MQHQTMAPRGRQCTDRAVADQGQIEARFGAGRRTSVRTGPCRSSPVQRLLGRANIGTTEYAVMATCARTSGRRPRSDPSVKITSPPTPLPCAAAADARRGRVFRLAGDGPAHAALVRPRPERARQPGDQHPVRFDRRCASATPKARACRSLFDRAVQDERLFAIGLCRSMEQMLRSTASFPRTLDCEEAQAVAELREPRLRLAGGPVHVGVHPVDSETGPIAKLVLLHDLSFIDRRSQDTRRYLIALHRRTRPGHRADHGGRRAAELARLGVRRSRPAARRRPAAAR